MLTSGTIVDGKYELLNPLGGGSFGAVYAAVQEQLGRKVAVKLLNTAVLQESDGAARFEREARAINSLKHKNIVVLYGYGAWKGAPYMVMELVDGQSLTSLLAQQRRLEPIRALRVIRQVFEALGCAHSSGVVHRDLKPSNIMLSADDEVKVIDFGLAKMMPGYNVTGQRLTETGCAVGTCHYMAPEQALGVDVDHRVDIYAAGCMLYQMIAGEVPFGGDDGIAIMYQHINEYPKPLTDFVKNSQSLQAISKLIENCMVKQPDKRYQTCAEVINDIDAILAGKVSTVTAKAQRPKKAKLLKPTRQLMLKFAAGIAVALCFMSVGYYKIDSDKRMVEQQQKHQHFEDSMVAQQLLRDNSVQSLGDLEPIKVRDDEAHYLDPAQRFALLSRLAELYHLAPNPRPGNRLMHQRLSFRCAKDAFELALANPDNEQIWNKLEVIAAVLRTYGDDTGANTVTEAMLHSKFPMAQMSADFIYSQWYLNHKDWDKAVKFAENGLKIPAGWPARKHDLECLLGEIETLLNHPAKARHYLTESAAAGNPEGFAGLARLDIFEGRYDEAIGLALNAEDRWEKFDATRQRTYFPYAAMLIAATAAKGDVQGAKRLSEKLFQAKRQTIRSVPILDALDEKILDDAMAGRKPTLEGFDVSSRNSN